MSDDNKAPGWRVRQVGSLWCVHDVERLIVAADNEPDARRIAEALNGASEAQEDAAEVRVWRDHAGAIDDVLGGYSLTLSRVQAVQAVVRERDELRAEVERLRAVAGQGQPADLAALVQEVEQFGVTMRRLSEQLAALAEVARPDHEITKLRAVVMAVADWLDAENDRPLGCGKCEDAYRVWNEAQIAIAQALDVRRPDWWSMSTPLRALAGGGR